MNIALFDTLHWNTATIRNQLFIVYMHSIKRTQLINETSMNRLVYEGHLMVHKCHDSKNDEECNSVDFFLLLYFQYINLLIYIDVSFTSSWFAWITLWRNLICRWYIESQHRNVYEILQLNILLNIIRPGGEPTKVKCNYICKIATH